jgi:hypothetical protein
VGRCADLARQGLGSRNAVLAGPQQSCSAGLRADSARLAFESFQISDFIQILEKFKILYRFDSKLEKYETSFFG